MAGYSLRQPNPEFLLSASNAIVLLSGGLDSATTLAIAHERGHTCHTLSFDYGQRHRAELDAARRSAIWPEATDADLMQEPEALRAALIARHPALMAEFRAAVESLGFIY